MLLSTRHNACELHGFMIIGVTFGEIEDTGLGMAGKEFSGYADRFRLGVALFSFFPSSRYAVQLFMGLLIVYQKLLPQRKYFLNSQ